MSRLTGSGLTVKASIALLDKSIGRINDRYDSELRELGARVRAELVIPFCRHYGFSFDSGMGSFCFFKGGQPFGFEYNSDAFDRSTAGKRMAVILDFLRSSVNGRNSIGEYVESWEP